MADISSLASDGVGVDGFRPARRSPRRRQWWSGRWWSGRGGRDTSVPSARRWRRPRSVVGRSSSLPLHDTRRPTSAPTVKQRTDVAWRHGRQCIRRTSAYDRGGCTSSDQRRRCVPMPNSWWPFGPPTTTRSGRSSPATAGWCIALPRPALQSRRLTSRRQPISPCTRSSRRGATPRCSSRAERSGPGWRTWPHESVGAQDSADGTGALPLDVEATAGRPLVVDRPAGRCRRPCRGGDPGRGLRRAGRALHRRRPPCRAGVSTRAAPRPDRS